jgi:hypothetical protein
MKIVVRSHNPAAQSYGPEIEVPDVECTRAHPSNQIPYLDVTQGGLLADGEPWRGEILRLSNCVEGDVVFAALGQDGLEPPQPRTWHLHEVRRVDRD